MSSMLDEIDDTIETAGSWPDGLQFRFPRRDFGSARWLLLGVLLVLLALLGTMIGRPIVGMIQNGVAFGDVMSLVIWAFIAIPLCRFPIWYLLVLLFGHTEIDVRPDLLSAGECVGGWRRNKRWSLHRLMRVQVFDLLPNSSGSAEFRSAIASAKGESVSAADSSPEERAPFVRHLHALTALLDDSKRVVLALAYPKPLLERFAQELADQIARARQQLVEDGGAYETRLGCVNPEVATTTRRTFGPAQSSVAKAIETAPAIGISELIGEAKEAIRKRAEPDVFEQPPDSRVEVDWLDDGGLTFRVPPAGVWHGSAGMFPFGVLFAVVTAGFTVLFAGAGIAQGQGGGGVGGAIGIMSLFWLVSGGMLLGGWVLGTRQSAIAVADEKVMVMQTGLRRAKRREWPRSEVKTARVGPSGTEVNDKPVLELQLLGTDDKKLFGMLMGRDVQELHWMSTLLRRALKGTQPATAEQSTVEEIDPATAQTKTPDPIAEFNYEGLTIEERLRVAKLSDEFAAAIKRGDRGAMLQMLQRVQLPAAGAAAFADTVLAEPRQHEA
ncbi:MAG TPA: hypothetical protein VFG04_21410 [Planctomycetaceae bacterium]|nr:hypothetical protein [Planctomycetaceae bacterium]